MTDDELKRLLADSAGEVRQYFDVVGEGLRRQVQLVAEGVSANGERVDRMADRLERLESSMHGEFEEMRSMIRLSYTEHSRVAAYEPDLA